jgi:CheY-like chemotaxis protein
LGEAAYRYTLVIGEDSPDRAWLEGILMRGGLEVAACSEAALLAMPDIVPPQLVILDDSISANGSVDERRARQAARLASFERIRAQPALAGVPVVLFTPDADLDSYSTAIERGAAAYLLKPTAAEEVVRVAHKLSGWLSSHDRTERRRRLRRPLLMRVDVAVAGRASTPGQIVDVSSGGCRIELAERVAEGDALRLTLHTTEGSTDLPLSAEVAWRRDSPVGDVVGLKFTGTTAVFAGRLLGTTRARA